MLVVTLVGMGLLLVVAAITDHLLALEARAMNVPVLACAAYMAMKALERFEPEPLGPTGASLGDILRVASRCLLRALIPYVIVAPLLLLVVRTSPATNILRVEAIWLVLGVPLALVTTCIVIVAGPSEAFVRKLAGYGIGAIVTVTAMALHVEESTRSAAHLALFFAIPLSIAGLVLALVARRHLAARA